MGRPGDSIIIGVNSAHAKVRRRFTVAHEIGHMLLHADQPLIVDESGYALLGQRADESNDRETEANAFAAALLMPAAWVENAERFGVSAQAMTFRLVNLGLVKNL